MGYRAGDDRTQSALFPVMLDELVEQDAVVRVVDAWCASLDLCALGFARTLPAVTGRPPYDPADLLKLYLYGYLGGVRSSRRLEKECHRNTEVMWLLGRLAPDHKTIADFRRTQSEALVRTAAEFVKFARKHRLIVGDTVAIDGSKIRAVASRKAVVSQALLAERDRMLEKRIQNYLAELDEADEVEAVEAAPRRDAVLASLQSLRKKQQLVREQLQKLQQAGVSSEVATEQQSRPMKSLGFAPGYNLQTAVDAHSHLIVHHDVIQQGVDSNQLEPMARATASVLQRTDVEVLADKGYWDGEQLEQLEQLGMQAIVPRIDHANVAGDGTLYPQRMFRYDEATDTFTCPAGQIMRMRHNSLPKQVFRYRTEGRTCEVCPRRSSCTPGKLRWVGRSHLEPTFARVAARLQERPDSMKRRAQTVEHPFASIKGTILGNARLLMRGIGGAKSELSLAALAYNFKRVINMKGAAWMAQAAGG
jgi:transposase